MIPSKKILIVTVDFDAPRPDFEQEAARLAAPIANVPGLTWKLWLTNPEADSAGGIYLFESEQALHDFVDGPIAAEINSRAGFAKLTMKVFGILDKPSRKTRAPSSSLNGPADGDYKI